MRFAFVSRHNPTPEGSQEFDLVGVSLLAQLRVDWRVELATDRQVGQDLRHEADQEAQELITAVLRKPSMEAEGRHVLCALLCKVRCRVIARDDELLQFGQCLGVKSPREVRSEFGLKSAADLIKVADRQIAKVEVVREQRAGSLG